MEKPQGSNTLIWSIVFIVGAIMLLISLSTSRTGQVWVTPTHHAFTVTSETNSNGGAVWKSIDPSTATNGDITWTTYAAVPEVELEDKITSNEASLSWPRTIGLWLAAMFTLFILSFLVGDNPAYKFAEAMVVGTSAGYVMVIGIWDVFVPDLLANLFPETIKGWVLPGLSPEPLEGLGYALHLVQYIIPAILIVMLLWNLMPSGGWISRWPIALFIGVTAGFRMIGAIEADLLAQIRAGIVPLWQTTDGVFDFWLSFKYFTITIATLSAMVYFFFSIEHKGFIGKTAKVGIWFMMITFGASFGYTVMGRIALLAARLEFLFGEWLHFIPAS
jgi:hypothetical protein